MTRFNFEIGFDGVTATVLSVTPIGDTPGDPPPPLLPAPTDFTVTATGPYAAVLSWSTPSFTAPVSLELYRNGRLLDTLSEGTSVYADQDLESFSNYEYRLRAVNATGSSDFIVANVATPAAIPNAPTDLEARHLIDHVEILWIDRDSQKAVTTFELQRSDDSSPWATIATLGEGVVTFIDSGTDPKGNYRYRINAANVVGASPYSDVATAAPYVYPPEQSGVDLKAGADLSKQHALRSGDAYFCDDGDYIASTLSIESGVAFIARNPGKARLKIPTGKSFAAKGATDVYFKGFVFDGGGDDSQDNAKAAVLCGDRWTLEKCISQNAAGVGISLSKTKGVKLIEHIAQDNGRAGIGGTSVTDGLLQHTICRRNNSKGDSNGGGGKFTRTNSLVIDGENNYDNTGPGRWFDYDNINVTVRNCDYHDNLDRMNGTKIKAGGDGLFFEISGKKENGGAEGPLEAINCRMHNNGIGRGPKNDPRCDMLVWGSCHVTIRGCDIGQITIRNNRTEPANRVGKNQIIGGTIESIWFDPAHKADRSQWTRDGKPIAA